MMQDQGFSPTPVAFYQTWEVTRWSMKSNTNSFQQGEDLSEGIKHAKQQNS